MDQICLVCTPMIEPMSHSIINSYVAFKKIALLRTGSLPTGVKLSKLSTTYYDLQVTAVMLMVMHLYSTYLCGHSNVL